MLNRLEGVFSELQRHEVEFVVIGGIAAVLHGVPRATFDLDILIKATPANAKKLLRAFSESGLASAHHITADELLKNEITIFEDKVRIDVQTNTPGLSFEKAWNERVSMNYQNQSFPVVSRENLIAAKKASGRKIDLEDVELLEMNNNNKN